MKPLRGPITIITALVLSLLSLPITLAATSGGRSLAPADNRTVVLTVRIADNEGKEVSGAQVVVYQGERQLGRRNTDDRGLAQLEIVVNTDRAVELGLSRSASLAAQVCSIELKENSAGARMKSILAIALVAITLAGCSYKNSGASAATAAEANSDITRLSEDEKHRLYSAALAASNSPLDSDTFKDVCQKIGIFDTRGQPNDQYMAFVAAHIEWAMKIETQQFKREINTTETPART